jgi:hypothetical protein
LSCNDGVAESHGYTLGAGHGKYVSLWNEDEISFWKCLSAESLLIASRGFLSAWAHKLQSNNFTAIVHCSAFEFKTKFQWTGFVPVSRQNIYLVGSNR